MGQKSCVFKTIFEYVFSTLYFSKIKTQLPIFKQHIFLHKVYIVLQIHRCL